MTLSLKTNLENGYIEEFAFGISLNYIFTGELFYVLSLLFFI